MTPELAASEENVFHCAQSRTEDLFHCDSVCYAVKGVLLGRWGGEKLALLAAATDADQLGHIKRPFV